MNESALGAVRAFANVAADVSCSRTQLALAWAASHPHVSSVILGATSVEQLNENLGAAAVDVTEQVKGRLEGIFV